MNKLLFSLTVSLLAVSALAQDSSTATAEMVDALNLDSVLGTVTLEEHDGGGVIARFDIGANELISRGEHAIHIHENGDCSEGDSDGDGTPEPAGAAGGHYDPTDVGHGEDNGPHVGDSENYNYTFEEDGSFTGDILFPQASLEGENPILTEGGTALMIHQGTDDRETDPGGESGPRIVCGVIDGGGSAE